MEKKQTPSYVSARINHAKDLKKLFGALKDIAPNAVFKCEYIV